MRAAFLDLDKTVLALTKGWSRDHVRSVVRATLEEVVEPIIYAEALELVHFHRREGHASSSCRHRRRRSSNRWPRSSPSTM